MGIIDIQDREYNVDCIIFDKDGTLIEFDEFWGHRTNKWVEAIEANLSLGIHFKNELYDLLGYSKTQNHVRFESPLAVATMDAIYTLAGGVISRYGVPWHEARKLAEDLAKATLITNLRLEEIGPNGDLIQVMQRIKKANIQIAVVTTDDRKMTEDTLSILGISDLVSVMICGDDPVPNKPAPDAVWVITEQLNIAPSQMMMVGDSLSDMQFASNAGVAFRVGISSSPESAFALAANADAVINSVTEITVPTKGKISYSQKKG